MKNLKKLVEDLNEILWHDAESRLIIERSGVKVSPCNYYSSIPSLDEIQESFEYRLDDEYPPYADLDVFASHERPAHLLKALTEFSGEFDPPLEGNEDDPVGYFWKNSQFSHSDAMAYYCFIRYFRPSKIVEIGSGFSTLIARQASEKNGETDLICVEPFPRSFLEQIEGLKLIKEKAQDLPVNWLNDNLAGGDVLFIDSTHTVKTGSDCLNLYLRMIPHIKHDVIIHVHDIFLPFGMPESWFEKHIYWTEQYLLLAFLINNPKIEFLFGSRYHQWKNEELLESFMGGKANPGGASFWFRYRGDIS